MDEVLRDEEHADAVLGASDPDVCSYDQGKFLVFKVLMSKLIIFNLQI